VFIKGIVFRIESKDIYILPDNSDEVIRASLRGKFKKDFHLKKDKQYITDIVVVGDRVGFELNKDGTGIIEKIDKRKNYLSRKAPRLKGASYRGERLEQIIASNIDKLIIVASVYEPSFNNKTIDRFLVAAESSLIKPVIVINKIDLDDDNRIKDFASLYSDIGYSTILTSCINGQNIEEVKNLMEGNVSILWGQSGVGKSSLLNLIYPGLNLETGEISVSTSKGKHTTVTVSMHKINEDTFIIDTPGIREIDPYGIKKEDLSHYFIDFLPFINNCKYNTCTHNHEPLCAVEEAVINGFISEERYDSYLRLLDTIEDDILF
jgi:ribosome biogenesis GTPase